MFTTVGGVLVRAGVPRSTAMTSKRYSAWRAKLRGPATRSSPSGAMAKGGLAASVAAEKRKSKSPLSPSSGSLAVTVKTLVLTKSVSRTEAK